MRSVMGQATVWLITTLMLNGCGLEPPEDTCYRVLTRSITNYQFRENVVSNGGIRLDTSGYEVDIDLLDRLVGDTESCLKEQTKKRRFAITKQCLQVKIADDWFRASCAGQPQAFPCAIPDDVCAEAKAKRGACEQTPQFDPDKCYCGGTIQNGDTLIVTPNLATLAHELVHLVTQAPDPIPQSLAGCAQPR